MFNAQKTPASRTLPKYVTRVAQDEIAQRFVSLPGNVTAVNANGTIVTVQLSVPRLNLPPVQMAVATSKYARAPIAIGDPGRAVSSTAYIGAVTGIGGGSQAPAALQPNLSALVWEPISNTAWTGNPANGVYTDATGASVLTLAGSGITLAFGGHTVEITSAGVTIDGILWETHAHTPGTFVAGSTAVTGYSGSPETPP